jgi:hypothetical protein
MPMPCDEKVKEPSEQGKTKCKKRQSVTGEENRLILRHVGEQDKP